MLFILILNKNYNHLSKKSNLIGFTLYKIIYNKNYSNIHILPEIILKFKIILIILQNYQILIYIYINKLDFNRNFIILIYIFTKRYIIFIYIYVI